MKLIKIYESILKFSGLAADQSGFINTCFNNSKSPALIDGKQLVLPLDNQLKSFNPNEKIIFHPLTENILRGESDVFQKLKLAVNVRLNYSIGILIQSLLNLIASPELHSKLTPEQNDLLIAVKDVDEKTVLNFTTSLVQRIKTKPDRAFINIYIKRGGTHNGERFARVGITSFPYYEELMEDKVDKLRVKDKEALKQLFSFLLPGISDTDNYCHGSSSQVAPNLDCLLKTAAITASRLNDITDIYKDFIDDADELVFNADWVEYFDNLEALSSEIRKIPVQFGNDGSVNIIEEQAQPQMVVPQMAVPQQVPMVQAPQQQPALRKTNRGLDFKSMMQTTPAVAYAGNALAPQLMQQQINQQAQMLAQQQPTWAQGQMVPQQMMQPVMVPQQMMQGQMVPQQMMQPVMVPQQMMPGQMVQQPTWGYQPAGMAMQPQPMAYDPFRR